jgi:hypothetical protein
MSKYRIDFEVESEDFDYDNEDFLFFVDDAGYALFMKVAAQEANIEEFEEKYFAPWKESVGLELDEDVLWLEMPVKVA